jgi:hypothetical protein
VKPVSEHSKFSLTRASVALFVLIAVVTFYRVLRTTAIDFVSLYTVEFALMILYISWVGVIRPLRDY